MSADKQAVSRTKMYMLYTVYTVLLFGPKRKQEHVNKASGKDCSSLVFIRAMISRHLSQNTTFNFHIQKQNTK